LRRKRATKSRNSKSETAAGAMAAAAAATTRVSAAPAAAPALDAATEKRLKALRKKLKQIDELKNKTSELDPEALRKLNSEQDVRDEIAALESGAVLASGAGVESGAALESAAALESGDHEPSILEQIESALSIESHVAMLLGPSEKRFRMLHKKLREIAKLMKQDQIVENQRAKIAEAPALLEDFLPLRSIAMEMDYDESDIQELKARREAAAKAAQAAAAAAVANIAVNVAPRVAPPPRIGIDVGGVLNKHLNDGDSAEPWDTVADSAAPGAMESLQKCVQKFGAANVFIVSKCSGEMKVKTERWLFETMDICGNAGVWRQNVYFCRDRFGLRGKGIIAGSQELSHFVDDRDDCLWSVYEDEVGNAKASIDRHRGKLFHMARGGDGARPPRPRDWVLEERPYGLVVPVRNWGEVLRELRIN